MTAALSTAILASETIDTGASPIAWGIGAFIIFMALLLGTLAFGKGRG